jgi:hypothetical protein
MSRQRQAGVTRRSGTNKGCDRVNFVNLIQAAAQSFGSVTPRWP